MKHPYHSRKIQHVTYVGKPGTGVYLLRESAKVSKEIKNRRMVTLSKRLGAEEYKNDGNSSSNPASAKFKKGADGKPIAVQPGGAGKMDIVPAHRQWASILYSFNLLLNTVKPILHTFHCLYVINLLNWGLDEGNCIHWITLHHLF